MKERPIVIREDLCIGCGLCVKDCPAAYIYVEGGKARTYDVGCIGCGHCYAICPQKAVELREYVCAEEPVVSMEAFDSDLLLAAMKSRRSVRQFDSRPVEAEKLRKILEAGRYSPTAGNSQALAFTVLGSRQAEAEAICVGLFRKGKGLGEKLATFLKRMEITDDFFFKRAPTVVVVSAKSGVDAGLASTYMELMAASMGLGVLYSGFFIACTKLSRKLRKLLDLPAGHKAVTCMVIGYPKVRYQRIPPRKDLQSKVL